MKAAPFVNFSLAGHYHCQFRVLLPKFLLGPSGWHACSSRVGLPHVNCLISDISPSARPSSSRCLGPRRGAQPPARHQSYRLLFSDPLNKGVGSGVVFVGISRSHLRLQGVSKKLSFTKLTFWRSCFKLGRNTYDICDKSGNAQFSKTQFF